jgi:hypothetical protein
MVRETQNYTVKYDRIIELLEQIVDSHKGLKIKQSWLKELLKKVFSR